MTLIVPSEFLTIIIVLHVFLTVLALSMILSSKFTFWKKVIGVCITIFVPLFGSIVFIFLVLIDKNKKNVCAN